MKKMCVLNLGDYADDKIYWYECINSHNVTGGFINVFKEEDDLIPGISCPISAIKEVTIDMIEIKNDTYFLK